MTCRPPRQRVDEKLWRAYTRVPGSPSIFARGAICAAFLGLATAAQADPCKAIPDKGPMPSYLRPGATFSGPVVYVGDGDGLCVALGPDPMQWVEVRIADFYGPELSEPGGRQAKAALERIAIGQKVACVAQRRSYDRVVARCTLRGISLGDHLRRAGVKEGGRGR